LILSACGSFSGGADVDDLETQNAQLQATIAQVGTPAATIVALQLTAEQSMSLQAELTNVQGTALAMQSTLSVFQVGGAQPNAAAPAPSQPNNSGNTAATGSTPPAIPTGAAAPSGVQTTFYQTTTARSRDANDCAQETTAIFTSDEGVIYVVARISNLMAGSTISARWMANGALFEDSVCWTPNSDWDDVCAYCDISPTGETFETGSWRVELLLDGQLMSQAQFQVVDPNAQPTQPAPGAEGDVMITPSPTAAVQ
jgi:hypothetical protein